MQGKKCKALKAKKNSQNSQSSQEPFASLPPIPDKRYFTIGEAALLCGVMPHVLRYWEQEFLQLKPAKRRGNRRYYQQQDVLMVRQIRQLLYEDGFTIEGARAKLAQHTVQPLGIVKKLIADLEGLLQNLKMTQSGI